MASPETLELPRSDFWFSFPAATYFLAIYLQEFGAWEGEVTSQSLLGGERLTLYLTCSRFYNHDNVSCENIQIYHQTSLQKLSEH